MEKALSNQRVKSVSCNTRLCAIPDPEQEGSSIIFVTSDHGFLSTSILRKFCSLGETIFPAPKLSIRWLSSLNRFGSISQAITFPFCVFSSFPVALTHCANWWVLFPGAAQQSSTMSDDDGARTKGGRQDARSWIISFCFLFSSFNWFYTTVLR